MPDTKYGKCPWCERHEQMLYFAIGAHDGKLWCGWICEQCLVNARDQYINDAMKGKRE